MSHSENYLQCNYILNPSNIFRSGFYVHILLTIQSGRSKLIQSHLSNIFKKLHVIYLREHPFEGVGSYPSKQRHMVSLFILHVPLLWQDPLRFPSLLGASEFTEQLPDTSLDPLAGEIVSGNFMLLINVSSQK